METEMAKANNSGNGENNSRIGRDISEELKKMEIFLRYEKRGYSVSEKTLKYQLDVIKSLNKKYGIEYNYDWLHMVCKDLEKRLTKNTNNAYRISLRNLFMANGHGDIKIALLKMTRQRPDKLIHSESEIKKMMAAAQNRVRDFAILNVLWYAALREGEVCHLYVQDFKQRCDGEKGYYIEVRGNGEGVKYNKSRNVPLEQPCVDALNRWLKFRESNGITINKLHIFL